MGVLCLILVLLFATLCPSSFATILMAKREWVVLQYLFSWCIVTVGVLLLFLTVSYASMQCVIVVFPDHTYLLFMKVDTLNCMG